MMFTTINEIEAPQLAELMSNRNDDLVIIDVREIGEMAHGIIPGAIAMPLATVPVRMNELDGSKKIILVCRSGARSANACYFLAQQGFDNTYNLRGGMMAWRQHGFDATLPSVAYA